MAIMEVAFAFVHVYKTFIHVDVTNVPKVHEIASLFYKHVHALSSISYHNAHENHHFGGSVEAYYVIFLLS